MSQLFDYFVCARALIDKWADALEQRDESLQQKIEAEMPRFLTLKNLSDGDVSILAACTKGDAVDSVKAVGQHDLVRAISEEEGPWITAFRKPTIEAIAKLRVGKPLLQRCVRAIAQFHGGTEAEYRKLLTAKVAGTLKDMCRLAVKKRLGVFTCFHG
jgi:hypothetical protein